MDKLLFPRPLNLYGVIMDIQPIDFNHIHCQTILASKQSGGVADTKPIDFDCINWYAKRAKAAYYKTNQEIQSEFKDTIRIATVPGTEVQYFLERNIKNGYQVITVRGTANLKNVLEDADYVTMKNHKLDIRVHKGFNDDTTKLYADVSPHLNKQQPVYVTGHSLGAAISTLLMMYLHKDGFKLEHSINFGQPKVTNKSGVEHYDFLPLTRIVDKNDVVPLVPPITLLDSLHGIYEHLGNEVILLEGEHFVYLDEHNAERESVGSFWENIGNESIEDHFMDNYLANIASKVKQSVQVPYDKREDYIK